ncbi:MAG: methyltransferase domain-containing protein [Rhodospirillales bacterium]|nr:methyltransferase domain-containing protein [Rhodospirillales bacterium]
MATCRYCNNQDLGLLIDLGDQPIAHRMLRAETDADPAYPLSLHSCGDCGLIQIVNPIDPDTLYSHYNFNFSSWKFEPHLADEIDTIFQHLSPASVLEVGCNDGRFLDALKEKGVPGLSGIEPNPVSGAQARDKGHTVYATQLDPDFCEKTVQDTGQFDLVVCRQVLEHLQDINGFFTCANILLPENGLLFIDVPDFEKALGMGDISMIWEEHVSYFTQAVLLNIIRHHGFDPVDVKQYDFSGGTIAVLARKGASGPQRAAIAVDADPVLMGQAAAYNGKVNGYRESLAQTLAGYRSQGNTVVLYGTGCRACIAVNGLGLEKLIDFAVDDQEQRQGLYMPGSRLPIRPSGALKDSDGKVVCLLAVNNESEAVVTEKVRSHLGEDAVCISLLGPKDIYRELQPTA